MEVVEFAVPLPPSILRGWDEPTNMNPALTAVAMQDQKGIVGTITLMGKKSAMIWFGWGIVIQKQAAGNAETATTTTTATATDSSAGEGAFIISISMLLMLPFFEVSRSHVLLPAYVFPSCNLSPRSFESFYGAIVCGNAENQLSRCIFQ